MLYKILCATAILFGFAHASNWAVLIAGSNQYYNYRHQADVSHAFQILTQKGGFPTSNVITMMYDDIANNTQNPKKGQLFNKPNGPDVYKGIVIDYKGDDVNSTNFLKVLAGDKAGMSGIGSGKVLESTEQDNVFIYYSDHGAFGFVGMPTPDYLYAHDLNATLTTMATKKMFKKLVFYLEACESGSMFDSILPGNENVWAITAANPNESSYAYYYDNTIGTYLGDEFSIHWMEDSDAEPLDSAAYTVEKQFEFVKNATKESHVMKYGEGDMASLPLGEFLLFNKFAPLASVSVPRPTVPRSESTDVRQVEIEILKKRIAAATSLREKLDLEELLAQELNSRTRTDELFANIVSSVTGHSSTIDHPHSSPRDFVCLKSSVQEFESKCGSLQGYGFKYGRTLAALCDTGYGFEAIKSAIAQVCPATIILNY